MDVEFADQFPEFDRSIFNEWLDTCETSQELLSAPLCAEPRAPTPGPVDVVVGEEIVAARQSDNDTTTAGQPGTLGSASQESKPKRNRRRGKAVRKSSSSSKRDK